MDSKATEIVDDLMRQVEDAEAASPGRRIIHHAVTLTDSEDVAAGPEITAMFERRLAERFSDAEIQVKGYGAGGYNIQAQITRN